MPLRPVMTVGVIATEEKKPEEKRTVVIKTDPKRPPNGRQDPRFTNGKNRKPDVRISEPEPEKKEEKVAVAAAAAVREAPIERGDPDSELPAR